MFDLQQREQISRAYAAASRAVFIWCFVLIAVCLVLTTLIRDAGLSRQGEDVSAQPQSSERDLENGNEIDQTNASKEANTYTSDKS